VFSLLKEFAEFLKAEKKLWLWPVLLLLLIIGAVVTVTSSSAIAPYIYTLF
jgi:hypothetical protein